jgi:hypothetical protein
MPSSLAYDSLLNGIAGVAPVVDFTTGFFKLLLVNGYSPNQGTDTTRASVTNETTGTGYTSGGLSATLTTSLNTSTHTLSVSLSNVVWSGSNTFSATGAVLYQSYGGSASGDPLVDYIDFAGTVSCLAGTFTVQATAPLEFVN